MVNIVASMFENFFPVAARGDTVAGFLFGRVVCSRGVFIL